MNLKNWFFFNLYLYNNIIFLIFQVFLIICFDLTSKYFSYILIYMNPSNLRFHNDFVHQLIFLYVLLFNGILLTYRWQRYYKFDKICSFIVAKIILGTR